MRKYEVALMLAKRYGYSSYLEICTPTTGRTFAKIDKHQFSRRVRLMYRRPSNFDDGGPFDFSTGTGTSEGLFGELVRSGERFDLVFVDPSHTYASSLRDIVFALHLIKSNGIVLVHDCNPPNQACAEPEFRPGEWCGVTFAAYLDVVLFSGNLQYATIDSDYGCGVISKDGRLGGCLILSPDAALISQWQALELPQKYPFFDENRSRLLKLISTDELRRYLA